MYYFFHLYSLNNVLNVLNFVLRVERISCMREELGYFLIILRRSLQRAISLYTGENFRHNCLSCTRIIILAVSESRHRQMRCYVKHGPNFGVRQYL